MRGLWVLSIVFLLLMAVVPFPTVLGAGPSVGDVEGGVRSNGNLTVNGTYNVTGSEVYDRVVVTTTGTLRIPSNANLEAERIHLQGDCVFEIDGGVVQLTASSHRDQISLNGSCSFLGIYSGSVITVFGPDGVAPMNSSRGTNARIDVEASQGIQIDRATINLTAGDGHSPNQPWDAGDIDGFVCAGGNATINLTVASGGTFQIIGSDIDLNGGDGGEAADGTLGSGNTRGKGGGFTNSGEVSGHVGAGGGASFAIVADEVDITSTAIVLDGGVGGDAGDAPNVGYGPQAGSGGGGYSGGNGATGLSGLSGDDGGDISGDVGSGGDCLFSVSAVNMSSSRMRLFAYGGDGGDAGDGGNTASSGASGAGGYSGGGGGSYYDGVGGNGGNVTDEVGSGGDSACLVRATGNVRLEATTIDLHAGDGGDAGDAGDAQPFRTWGSGAGGGGFSGGGGGGQGALNGRTNGQDGGDGGDVSGNVSVGGKANATFDAKRMTGLDLTVRLLGGDGGDRGFSGTSSSAVSGGGGGGYSTGGGGGRGSGKPHGIGGTGGLVTGNVGDGGSAHLNFDSPWVSLDEDSIFTALPGTAGNGTASSAPYTSGGSGVGRDPSDGTKRDDIPMSRPTLLWPPDDYHQMKSPLTFNWTRVHWSTSHGVVANYVIQVDDDPDFSTPEVNLTMTAASHTPPAALAPGDYHWRVKAVYTTPAGISPGWSDTYFLKWGYNSPPVLVSPIGDISILKNSVDVVVANIHDVFFDPDGDRLEISISGNVHISVTILTNGTVLMTPDPGWTGIDRITFTAKEVLDVPSEVKDTTNVTVFGINHPPEITTTDVPDAVEDVPYSFQLTLSDIDVGDVHTWEITSSASFLVLDTDTGSLSGTPLNEHVGTHWINISVKDYDLVDHLNVTFTVENTNDPPEITTDDVVTCFDGDAYSVDYDARDVDPTGDILTWSLDTNASFLSIDPDTGVLEGVPEWEEHGSYWISVLVTDGNGGEDISNFTLDVLPSDLPPTVGRVSDQTVVEEQAYQLDLTRHISDVDTHIDELTLECSDPAVVGIDGLRITLLYPEWVPDHELTFHVMDAHWRVEGAFLVRVVPVDDPPVIDEVPAQSVVEGTYSWLDLAPYLLDEDTPIRMLRLDSTHPAVTDVDGLVLELLFEEWEPDLWIDFWVSDNTTRIEGSFLVKIEEVNDAPRIVGIGDLAPPYDIHVDEGTTLVLDISVEDEDDTSFVYAVECEYPGVTVDADGTLRIEAAKGDIGEHMVTLTVSDGRGGEDIRGMLMTILNVNDAPVIVSVLPESGSSYYEGKVLELSVIATDEDGDPLTYTWSIGEWVLGTGQAIDVKALGPGEHNITLLVSDGLGGEASSYVIIEILEPGGDDSLIFLMIVIALVVVGVVLYMYRDRLRRSA